MTFTADMGNERKRTMSKYIDADYLIDTIGAMIGYGSTPTEIWEMVNDAPTIDAVEVVHGEWIDRSDGIEGAWNYCSVCGEQAIDLYDFCPNCGAKMDGERKESE